MTYTFITNYRGGTYIEQVAASDVRNATLLWADKTANDPEVEHLDAATFRQAAENELAEFPPVPIFVCKSEITYFCKKKQYATHSGRKKAARPSGFIAVVGATEDRLSASACQGKRQNRPDIGLCQTVAEICGQALC